MSRTLYKNEEKGKLAGVCQGVAEYFDLDPTLVRVIWFVVSWAWGVGVGVYILLAIILPSKSEVEEELYKEEIPIKEDQDEKEEEF